MNDNPTPEEIAEFEAKNPGIVKEEKETQSLPQWPIRLGLMLLPLLCFWEWSWFKKATKKLPIVMLFVRSFILIFLMAFRASATNYFVASSGSDANNGLSTGAAWQHDPVWASFTGTYSHSATNDRIFIHGGDKYTGSIAPWNITTAGSSTTWIDYHGTNGSWGSGQVLFDYTNFPCTSMAHTAYEWVNASYVWFRGLTFSNMSWANNNSGVEGFNLNTSSYVWITDCQFWNPCPVSGAGDNFDNIYGGATSAPYNNGCMVSNCFASGWPSVIGCGFFCHGSMPIFVNNVGTYMPNVGEVGFCLTNYGCTFSNVPLSISGTHPNCIEIFMPSSVGSNVYSHNNLFVDTTNGELTDLDVGFGGTAYVYDDVAYGNFNAESSFTADPSPGSGTFGSVQFFNITVQDAGTPSWQGAFRVINRAGAQLTSVLVSNCFGIFEGGGNLVNVDAGVTATITQGNNYTMNNVTAAGYGFTSANGYQPTTTSPTRGAGQNLASLFAAINQPAIDYLGVSWSIPPDAGAYQFPGGGKPPSPVIGFGGSVFIKFGGNTLITP